MSTIETASADQPAAGRTCDERLAVLEFAELRARQLDAAAAKFAVTERDDDRETLHLFARVAIYAQKLRIRLLFEFALFGADLVEFGRKLRFEFVDLALAALCERGVLVRGSDLRLAILAQRAQFGRDGRRLFFELFELARKAFERFVIKFRAFEVLFQPLGGAGDLVVFLARRLELRGDLFGFGKELRGARAHLGDVVDRLLRSLVGARIPDVFVALGELAVDLHLFEIEALIVQNRLNVHIYSFSSIA